MKNLPYKWKALITVAYATLLATLDASIVNIAFPEFTRRFHVDLTKVMWITVVYVLVSSGTMLAFGKLSDSIGRKRIYTIGLGIFTLGMAACSLARGVDEIIFFRIVQALGAAMSIGCSTAIVTEAFPPKDLGQGLGLLGVAVSVGFVAGPVTGGFLLDWLDWRAIFYARIPFGILAILLALFTLEKDTGRRTRVRFDFPGTATSFAGLFCLLFGMGQIKSYGATSPLVIALVTAGLAILGLFLFIESRAKDPLIRLDLFRNHAFTCAVTGLFVFFLASPFYGLIMPFFLVDALEMAPTHAGLLLSVIPVATMIASPVSGFFTDRMGPRWPSIVGAGAIAAAFLCMSWFNLDAGPWTIVLVFALLGVGIGAYQPPNNKSIMGAVAQDRFGSVSALIGTSRQVAISIGMALSGALFSVRQGMYHELLRVDGIEASQLLRRSIPPAFREVILISFALSLLILLLSLLTPKTNASE